MSVLNEFGHAIRMRQSVVLNMPVITLRRSRIAIVLECTACRGRMENNKDSLISSVCSSERLPSLLLGSGAGVHGAGGLDGGRRGDCELGIGVLSTGCGLIASGGDVNLNQRRLRCSVGGQGAQRAAAWQRASAVLGPTLVLNRHGGAGAEILLELVAVGGVIDSGAGVRDAATAPSLRGIFVLSGTELTGSLSLLFQRLLLLRVGVADLNLKFLAVRRNRVVVEGLNDLFAGGTSVESVATLVIKMKIEAALEHTGQSQRHGHGHSCHARYVMSTHHVVGIVP